MQRLEQFSKSLENDNVLRTNRDTRCLKKQLNVRSDLTFGSSLADVYLPPVTSINEPVVYEASSDNSHKIALATSIA